MEELRLYTFCNFYLSQIQGGIQSAHLVHEAFVKYNFGASHMAKQSDQLWDWARNHKTMIVLNGGPHEYILNRFMFFQRELGIVEDETGTPMPWGSFNEDEFSLHGLMTCVGVVLPSTVFNAVDYRTANNAVADPRAFAQTYEINQREGWFFVLDENKNVVKDYKPGSATSRLITDLKSCRLF